MASSKSIRGRIQSIKNTRQITKAMKMVSAVKLRKAQLNVVNSRPYARRILSVISNIAVTQRVEHPLLSRNESPKSVLIVVLTSDRGLCGSFNSSIQRFSEKYYFENKNKYEKMDFLFIGRKAAEYFKKHKVQPVQVILNMAKEISYTYATKIADLLIEKYLVGHYDEIRMVYNEFKSAIAQNVVCETLLPIDLSRATLKEEDGVSKDFIFEPQPGAIIEQLLKKHFSVQVYRCMSESVAAEHGSRMTAMENATNNANEVIRKTTIIYNNLRQAAVTTQLIEITSGAEALKG
ncbi:MAG: ATP synthase F1 subunit gamma [Pseudomonadota bacterium]|nr:ATP synthase F1 subunit gamma [Pseudomonadota bacterium]